MDQKSEKCMEAVIRTLSYFDGQEMALTPFEIWYYLFSRQTVAYGDVERAIAGLREKNVIELHSGFVTLSGRSQVVKTRMERESVADEKYKTALGAAKLLRFVPFIRLIAVCNTLAFDMTRDEGDIDFFIVAKSKRLYMTRFLVTLLLQIAGMRRHGLAISDRICLSFYVDETGADLSRFALPEGDPYLAYWTRQLVPMFEVGDSFRSFMSVNRNWLSKYFWHVLPYDTVPRRRVSDTVLARAVRGAGELVLSVFAVVIEPLSRSIQLRRMLNASDRHIRLSATAVVVDAHTLKFHEEDRREFFKSRMEKVARTYLNKAYARS